MEFNSTVNCTVVDEDTVECFGMIFTRGGEKSEGMVQASSPLFWAYLFVYIFLVLFAGRFLMKLRFLAE